MSGCLAFQLKAWGLVKVANDTSSPPSHPPPSSLLAFPSTHTTLYPHLAHHQHHREDDMVAMRVPGASNAGKRHAQHLSNVASPP